MTVTEAHILLESAQDKLKNTLTKTKQKTQTKRPIKNNNNNKQNTQNTTNNKMMLYFIVPGIL